MSPAVFFETLMIVLLPMALLSSQSLGAESQHNNDFKLPAEKRWLSDADLKVIEQKTQKIEITPNEFTPKFMDYFHVEMKTSLAASSYDRNIMDITASYFGLTVGDKVDEALNNFSKYAKNRKFLVGLNLKTSIAPLVLRDRAKDEINHAIYEKVKAGAVAAAALKVKQGFEKDIYPMVEQGRMTETEYQAILATNLAQTKVSVENNKALIDRLAAPIESEADHRVNVLVDEFLLQELAVKFAWSPNEDDGVIIFGTVGKALINANLKQGVKGVMAFSGWANLGNTTQGTGDIHMGVQSVILDDIKMTLEAWVFHNRLPVRSGQTILFNVTTMTPEAFQSQQDVFNLNSNMQKITIEKPSKLAPATDSVYFSTGDFAGDRSFGGGAIVRVLPKISIEVEANYGRKALYQGAIMEAIIYHFDDQLTLYVANENVKDLKSAYNVANPKLNPGQLGSATIGAGYTVGKWKLIDDVTAAVNATLGLKYFYENKGMYNQDTFGVDGAITGQINWQ